MMIFWLGETLALGMFASLNPLAWLWGAFASKWMGNISRPLELAAINAVCAGILLIKNDSFDLPQIIIGSLFSGFVIHFGIVLIGKSFRTIRKAAEASTAAVTSPETGEKLQALSSNVKDFATSVATRARSTVADLVGFNPDEYEDDLFETALSEIESGLLVKATWAKALTISNGDKDKARAKYIELRVKDLNAKGAS